MLQTIEKQYPADFRERVLKAFPRNEKLHEALLSGDSSVGRFLDQAAGHSDIAPSKVIELITGNKVSELFELARQTQERKDLFRDWQDIAKEMFPGQD